MLKFSITRASISAALFVSLLGLSSSGMAQANDEGPARQSPAQMASAQLSNQQLEALDKEAKNLEMDLDSAGVGTGIVSTLRIIDETLAGVQRGEYLFVIPDLSRDPESGYEDGVFALLTGPELAASINRIYPKVSLNRAQEAYRRAVQNSESNRKALLSLRAQLLKERDAKLARLDQIRRMVMADADRPGQAYNPNAAGAAEPGPSFAWDTRTRIHGIECFGGAQYPVYTDHYGYKGQYAGVDRKEYDRVRAQASAGGAPFCGAWETRREVTTK